MASNIDVGLDVSREQEKFLKKVKQREREKEYVEEKTTYINWWETQRKSMNKF